MAELNLVEQENIESALTYKEITYKVRDKTFSKYIIPALKLQNEYRNYQQSFIPKDLFERLIKLMFVQSRNEELKALNEKLFRIRLANTELIKENKETVKLKVNDSEIREVTKEDCKKLFEDVVEQIAKQQLDLFLLQAEIETFTQSVDVFFLLSSQVKILESCTLSNGKSYKENEVAYLTIDLLDECKHTIINSVAKKITSILFENCELNHEHESNESFSEYILFMQECLSFFLKKIVESQTINQLKN
jgi:hypothetical protein